MSKLMRSSIRLMLPCLLGALASTAAVAQVDLLGTTPSQPARAGLTVDVAMPGGGRLGYQPIELRIRPTGTQFRRERRITVVLQLGLQNGRLQTTFRQTVRLAEGSTGRTETLLVPRYYAWDNFRIRLEEDGETIETSDRGLSMGGLRRRGAQQNSTIGLIVSNDAADNAAEPWNRFPDVRTLVTVFGDGPLPEGTDIRQPRLDYAAAKNRATKTQPAWVQFRILHEFSAPDDWLAYSQFDAIAVAEPVLQRITQNRPKSVKALQSWVASGGNLWIYAADFADPSWLPPKSFSKPDLNAISRGSPRTALRLSEQNDTSELTFQYWQGVIKGSANYNAGQGSMAQRRQTFFDRLVAAGHPFAEERDKADLSASLRMANFGAGEIILIKDQDPFPGSYRLWQTVARMHGDADLQWANREGLDIQQGNNSYWNWLIPSVGEPPVVSFVVLNTLFVIIVGPVSYFFFRRRGRLYLLYLFAPAFAIVVTTCLFAYALLSDGIRTQIRARQITWIDPIADYQVVHARQTYFKSFGSGSQITFDKDVAVYPVFNRPIGSRYYYRSDRNTDRGTITHTSDQQFFGGYYFPIRDQVQYLLTRPEPTSGTVRLQGPRNDKAVVTNDTPFTMSPLLVSDGQSKIWIADRADAGETVTLREITQREVKELMRPRFFPEVEDVPQLAGNPRVLGKRNFTIPTKSQLETVVDQWISDMPQATFMGMAPLREDLLGVDNAVRTDSLHLVMGALQ